MRSNEKLSLGITHTHTRTHAHTHTHTHTYSSIYPYTKGFEGLWAEEKKDQIRCFSKVLSDWQSWRSEQVRGAVWIRHLKWQLLCQLSRQLNSSFCKINLLSCSLALFVSFDLFSFLPLPIYSFPIIITFKFTHFMWHQPWVSSHTGDSLPSCALCWKATKTYISQTVLAFTVMLMILSSIFLHGPMKHTKLRN